MLHKPLKSSDSDEDDDAISNASSILEEERRTTEALSQTHIEYVSDAEEDNDDNDPESQTATTFTSLINKNYFKETEDAYENIYNIDDENLHPDDLMSPLNTKSYSNRKSSIHRLLILPLGMIFIVMSFSMAVIFILSINDVNPISLFTHKSVKYVPDDIAMQCSSLGLKTIDGWNRCKNTCNVAKCCILPVNNKDSCLQKYEVQCSKFYHYCRVMFDSDGIPPLSTTKSSSSISSISSTPMIGSNGNSEFNDQAQAEEEEQNINNNNNNPKTMIIPPAPRNIGLICSSSNLKTIEGFSECEKLCLPATCCYSTTSTSCSNTQNSDCIGYSVCINLQHSSHVSTPTLLQNVCGYKTLSTEGRTKCEAACKPAQCCFDGSNDCSSANSDLVINCMEYERCFFLYEDDHSTTNNNPIVASQQQQQQQNNDLTSIDKIYLVNEACTYNAIATDKGRTACYDLCSERSCCFLSEWSGCYKDKTSWCLEYKACEILLSNHNNNDGNNKNGTGSAITNNNALVNGPSITDICSDAAMSSIQGRDTCFNQCNQRSCCYSLGFDNCYDEYKTWCDEYIICSTRHQQHLIDLTPGNPNLEMSGKDWANTLDTITNACVQDTTPPYHLQDGATCHSYCQDLKCCFLDNRDNGSCYNTYDDYCDQFYMCGVMYNNNDSTTKGETITSTTTSTNNNNNKIDASLQEICSDYYMIQNGQSGCTNKCLDRKCCFIPEKEDGSCFLKNPSWCEEFIPCTNLEKYGDKKTKPQDLSTSSNNNNNKENEIDSIVLLVKEACYVSPDKANTSDYAKCAKLCQSRICCFQTDDDNELSCYSDKKDWCEQFSPCYKLNINDLITNSGGSSSSSSISQPPYLKFKVDEACAKESLKTSSGMTNCGNVCADKKCCFDDSSNTSPLKKQSAPSSSATTYCDKEICKEYNSCKTFFDQTSNDKPKLESLCTHTEISDNYEICSKICAQRSCCFQWGNDGNCYTNNENWCDEFHPCYNLNWVDVSKEQTSELISESCSKMNIITEAGRERCLALCEDHACCFSETDDNCYKQETEFCVGYESCSNLYIKPQEMIEEFCAKEQIDTALGYSVCAVLCTGRSCCFKKDSSSCYDDFKGWCDEFDSCHNIAGIENILDSHANDQSDSYIVADVCSKTGLLEEGAAGRKDCQEICSERYCCFAQGRTSCYDKKRKWCTEFEACTNLEMFSFTPATSGGTSTSTTLPVNKICATDNLKTSDGVKACEETCQTRSCCFSMESDNCYIEKKGWCEEYSSCKNLDSMKANNNMDQKQQIDEKEKENEVDIDTLCSEKSTSYLEGLNKCKTACEPHACCFARDEIFNCWDKQPHLCETYRSCENLLSDDFDDDDDDNTDDIDLQTASVDISKLNEFCTKDTINMDNNYDLCKQICSSRGCCFHWGKENCVNKKWDYCNDFKMCYNLDWADFQENETDEKNGDLKFVVHEACTELNLLSEAGRERCDQMCEDRECCFETDSALNCWSYKKDWCEGYQACNNLNLKVSHMLEEFCAKNKVLSGVGYATCEVLCTSRACCFVEGPGNCRGKYPTWCKEMDICSQNLDMPSIMRTYNGKADSSIVQKVCKDVHSLPEGDESLKDCREICSERACCFLDGRDNCSSKYKDWCDEFSICENLKFNSFYMGDLYNANDNDDGGSIEDDDGGYSDVVAALEKVCSKSLINHGNNYNKCKEQCQTRECCFRWGKENCLEEREDWCDDFRLCYNLDWADEIDNKNSKGDLLFVVEEACSKLNLLTEAGEERCDEICEDRECCFDPDLANNCWKTKPDFCEGYQPCANMNIKDEDLLKEFCSKEKIATGLGYAVCEVMCTTRPCCFYEGDKNCAEQFPSWCASMDICKQNLNMPHVMSTYNDKMDVNIVQKVCDESYLLSEGHQGRKDCKQLCSERACCFLPGRDNCSSKYKDWCEEFAACNNLDLFANDDYVDYDDEEEELANTEKGKLNIYCTKDAISSDDNYNSCKNSCASRECCFHWGKENCVDEKEDWCDEFKLCYNLDWADMIENKDSKGDLLIVVEESCSKLNLLTKAGERRCQEICEERECCYDTDLTKNCWKSTPELCEGYEPCANMNIKEEDLLKEFCSKDKVGTGLGYAVCEVLCTTRLCCFAEGQKNCAKEFPSLCSSMDICNQNLDMPAVLKSYNGKTDGNIVQKVCDDSNLLSEGLQGRKDCKEMCSERGCCFLPGRDNCYNKYIDWCSEFEMCNNLDLFANDDYGDYDDDDNNDEDLQALELICSRDKINLGDNYNQCNELCQKRECCFHWGKENCVEEQEDWCDEFGLCYNLDWADKKGDTSDLLFVVNEACTKFNIISEAGVVRCEELCEDRKCCYDPNLAQNCWNDKPDYCEGYESCSNLNIEAPDILEEFCSKDKVYNGIGYAASDKDKNGLGYSICEVLCTSRMCCFQEGPKNCANEFPKWCAEFELCSENLDMKSVMLTYSEKFDASVVSKVCGNVDLLPTGHEGRKDCKELCSERACCFMPGRDNCSTKYKAWCDEYSSCLKLDHLLATDDTYDDDTNDGNKQTEDKSKNDETTAPIVTDDKVDEICSKENVKTETGRYHCESICTERSCCFLVGYGNCHTSSRKWCDEYSNCQNLFFST